MADGYLLIVIIIIKSAQQAELGVVGAISFTSTICSRDKLNNQAGFSHHHQFTFGEERHLHLHFHYSNRNKFALTIFFKFPSFTELITSYLGSIVCTVNCGKSQFIYSIPLSIKYQ